MTCMHKAKVTVCIPAYNRPDFLREALMSLCDQGLSRDEYVVMISDDASPASLHEVVLSFKKRLQIIYHRNDANVGHIANFERAFTLADTPYVSFLPHDDVIAPGQLKRVLSAIDEHSGTVLVASLVLCQRNPGALRTYPHGMFLRGAARARFAEPYLWDRTEWMALGLVSTPLSIVGSVFHADTFGKCQYWKSFPIWHDRLMLAEMGLHGGVVSLPWIGGHYRVSDGQLSRQLMKTKCDEFAEVSKVVLQLCESANIPVIAFWINHVCEAGSEERVMYLNMLNVALPSDAFKSIKSECEHRLKTRLHLGGRLARMGVPWSVAEVLRRIDRFVTLRLG